MSSALTPEAQSPTRLARDVGACLQPLLPSEQGWDCKKMKGTEQSQFIE
jgi:hypothetical protein